MAFRKAAPIQLPENVVNLLRRIEHFFFPALCIVCDAPRNKISRWFCPLCLEALHKNSASREACPHCGQNTLHRACACDVVWDEPVVRIVSFYDYDDCVQAIMQQIKYQGKKHLAHHVGAMCAATAEKTLMDSVDLVIPIPLHWMRRQKRGYNQTEWFVRGLLGDVFASKLSLHLLKRKRSTATQTKLDKSARQKNVAGAFLVPAAAVPFLTGKRILLVDDVITTGATTSAAARALLAAGCKEVTTLSFARD